MGEVRRPPRARDYASGLLVFMNRYIVIPGSALSARFQTGVENYTSRIIKELDSSIAPDHKDIGLIVYTRSRFFSRGTKTSPAYNLRSSRLIPLDVPFFWTQLGMSYQLLKLRFVEKINKGVLFSPEQKLPRILGGLRVVAMVHGLEYERLPGAYSLKERAYLRAVTKDTLTRAVHIITPSRLTKKDLIEIYGFDSKKISVVVHGSEKPAPFLKDSSINPRARRAVGGYAYFLYVGRIEPKKNLIRLAQAFKMAVAKGRLKNTRLLIAGPLGHQGEGITAKLRSLDGVRWLGYIEEDEKWRLLSGAVAFVYPSLYEGFGMPVLEAQRCGTPVISSKTGGTSEILGDSAILIDPTSTKELSEALLAIKSEDKRRALIKRGSENVKRFSWQRAGQQTLRIIERYL